RGGARRPPPHPARSPAERLGTRRGPDAADEHLLEVRGTLRRRLGGERGATQFFEGLFDVRLAPGESYQHTFRKKGEYFFNDPHSPRSTGKIEVY
ncbi:MAG: hypothetical protein WBA97_21995, partial [Actinophytocola sp.]|uniref:cupredoxin domain-containing protein n=1 Tax=Actinophytocola sp. TaxID=1872138 RepID=UPI003C719E84